MEPKLNQEEYNQYDRQIHIWGAENQKKIITSNVAFVNCDSLCAEVAKNIVLAGMNVSLCDDALVQEGEYRYNYFLRKEDKGKLRRECIQHRLQELNPRALLTNSSIQDIAYDSVSVILFCNPDFQQIEWIDSLQLAIPVFCMWSAQSWGLLMNAHSHKPLHTFLNSSVKVDEESILPQLIAALQSNQIPSPSPISIQAIIGGVISQTLVSIVTGQGALKDSIEFDATTLNVTEFSY